MARLPAYVVTDTTLRGHAVAAVLGPRGALGIDAPLLPADAEQWIRKLLEKGAGRMAFIILLDSSPDRAIAAAGLRALPGASQAAIVAHQRTADLIKVHPDSLKTSPTLSAMEAGSMEGGMNLAPWSRPQITFSDSLTFHWGDTAVEVLHVPSVTPGAVWVHLAQERLLFVGDSVAVNTPPFLGEAQFENWLAALASLRHAPFRGSRVFCSRSGWVTPEQVNRFASFVRAAQRRLETLKDKNDPHKDLARLASSLCSYFSFPQDRRGFVEMRLRLGLQALWERDHGVLPGGVPLL